MLATAQACAIWRCEHASESGSRCLFLTVHRASAESRVQSIHSRSLVGVWFVEAEAATLRGRGGRRRQMNWLYARTPLTHETANVQII